MFDTFYTKLSDVVDTHLPLKQISKRELRVNSKPWTTRAIRVSINIKKVRFMSRYVLPDRQSMRAFLNFVSFRSPNFKLLRGYFRGNTCFWTLFLDMVSEVG